MHITLRKLKEYCNVNILIKTSNSCFSVLLQLSTYKNISSGWKIGVQCIFLNS